MNRITRTAMLLAVSAVALTFSHNISAIEEEVFIANPYLTNLRHDRVTINYVLERPLFSWILFDTESHFDSGWNYTHGYPPQDIISDRFNLTLPGLQSDEKYYYTVILKDPKEDEDNSFYDYLFKTPPPPGEKNRSFKIGIYGASHGNPNVHRAVADNIASESDMIAAFMVGDILPPDTTDTSWREFFYSIEYLGGEKAIVPLKGENEENVREFNEYFPFMDETSGPKKPLSYYSCDWGSIHNIVLDSNLMKAENHSRGEQIDWLVNDLEKNQDSSYTFVYLYHPPISSDPSNFGGVSFVRELIPIFDQYNVSAVFSGKDDVFQYYMHSKTHYFNLGSLTNPGSFSSKKRAHGGVTFLENTIVYLLVQILDNNEVKIEIINMGTIDSKNQAHISKSRAETINVLPRNGS